MPEFSITGLRVVLEVRRTGSFSIAADRLGYTQSAISRQIAASENAAGTPLFVRHARGVRPTAAGEALARHAATILDGVTAAEQELAGLRDQVAGRLSAACFPAAAATLMPRAIAAVTRTHPGLVVRLRVDPSPKQLVALRRGRIEVAVIATGPGLPDYDLDGVALTGLRTSRGPGIAVAEGHPLAARHQVTPGDLVDQPWIVGGATPESPEFGAWPGLAEPVIAFTARDWPTRFGLVAAGLGIALVPGIAADAVPRGVRWIPVQDDGGGLGRQGWAVTAVEPTAAAAALVRALVDEASRLS